MVQVFGNRILGGIGAPDSRAAETFGAGVNTSITNRSNRQVMDERAQAMRIREEEAARLKQRFGWDIEDRARTAAAYDAFGAPAVGGAPGTPPRAGVNVAGLFGKSDVRTQLTPVWTNLESQYKLPAGYLERTAFIESGFDPAARNAASSAGGLFQFIDSTAKQYGLSDKFDPMASSNAAAQLAANNAMYLQRVLGRPPTGAELYLAHQQGAGGAAKLLANPNALAVDVVGADAVRNNGGQMDMTAAEFADLWLSKWAGQGPQPYTDRSQRFAPAPGGVQPVVDTTGSSQRFPPMPRQPDQSQRFRPGDYAAALEALTPDTGVRFNSDGTIALPTAPQGRPGDFAAQGTAARLSALTPSETDPTLGGAAPQVLLERAQKALTLAEIAFANNPTGETAARAAAARAEVNRLTPLVENFISATRQYPNQRDLLSVEGPGATGMEAPMPTVRAGVTVPPAPTAPAVPVQTAGPDTPRPRARPELTFQQSEDALIAAEQAAAEQAAAAEQTAAQQPTDAQAPTSPGVEPPPAAGVTTPSVTTSDVRAGASVMTDTGSFPGLAALFQDTAMVGQEEAALAAKEQALLRRMEFARQTRDATTLMEADEQLALIQARRTTLGYIKAGNAAMSGNFDPMASVLSEMSGQTVRITPTGAGTYDVTVDGRVAQSGVDPLFMVQQYMYGVNEAYRTQVDAARAARVTQAAEQAKYAAEQAKVILEAELQYAGEQTIEEIKGRYALLLAAQNPDLDTASLTLPDQSTALMVFSKKNPNAPLTIVQFQTNSDGTIEPVQVPVTDLQRNQ